MRGTQGGSEQQNEIMMAVIAQGNLGRRRLAQDMLAQVSYEHSADMFIIAEQHRNMDGP